MIHATEIPPIPSVDLATSIPTQIVGDDAVSSSTASVEIPSSDSFYFMELSLLACRVESSKPEHDGQCDDSVQNHKDNQQRLQQQQDDPPTGAYGSLVPLDWISSEGSTTECSITEEVSNHTQDPTTANWLCSLNDLSLVLESYREALSRPCPPDLTPRRGGDSAENRSLAHLPPPKRDCSLYREHIIALFG